MDKLIISQLNLYHEIKTSVTKLENVLKHQEQIQKNHSIPKKYKPPKHLTVFESSDCLLQNSFEQEYKRLFFNHLHHIITANKVALELKIIRLQSICQDIENKLPEKTNLPEPECGNYRKLLYKLNITVQELDPKFKHMLCTSQQISKDVQPATSKQTNTISDLCQRAKSVTQQTPPPGHTTPSSARYDRKRQSQVKHPKGEKKQQTLTKYFLGPGENHQPITPDYT